MSDCDSKVGKSTPYLSLKLCDSTGQSYYCKAWNIANLAPAINTESASTANNELIALIGEHFMAKLQKTVKRNQSGEEMIYMNILRFKKI